MATNLQLYTLAYVTINGSLLTEEGSVSVKRSTGASIVETVSKGFSGVSPGSEMCTIEIDNAVPSADFELDPGPFMKSLSVVEVGLIAAGKAAVSKGFILEDTFSHSTGSASKLSFSFTGQFPEWQ